MNTSRLGGRTVVISGAASGIGRALAERLSGAGCPVAISDIDSAGLDATAACLSGKVLSRVLDVRDAKGQQEFANDVRDWAPADIGAVFNNAGVALDAKVIDADPNDDQWLWDINFHGVVNGTRAFLPMLVEQDSGGIVNISSVYGLAAMPGNSAYCAAKFAVRGFTDSLRHELRGTGVSATVVHPGGISTNIARNARVGASQESGRTREEMARDFAAIALTRPGQAADIICRGVEKGKARILVGPDAYVFDVLTRLTPTYYYDITSRLERLLGRLQRQAVTNTDR